MQDVKTTKEIIKTLAEITLGIVLFADASLIIGYCLKFYVFCLTYLF